MKFETDNIVVLYPTIMLANKATSQRLLSISDWLHRAREATLAVNISPLYCVILRMLEASFSARNLQIQMTLNISLKLNG